MTDLPAPQDPPINLEEYVDQIVEVTTSRGRHGFGRLEYISKNKGGHYRLLWEDSNGRPIFRGNKQEVYHFYSSPPDCRPARINIAERTVYNWITHRSPVPEDRVGGIVLCSIDEGIPYPNRYPCPSGTPWCHHPAWKPPVQSSEAKDPSADERIAILEAQVKALCDEIQKLNLRLITPPAGPLNRGRWS